MLKAADLQAQATALGLPAMAATSVAFYHAVAMDRIADAIAALNVAPLAAALAAIGPDFHASVYGDAGKTMNEQQLAIYKTDQTVAQERLTLSQDDQTMAQNFITALTPLIVAWKQQATLEGGSAPATTTTTA